jgi:hypothetical protein
VQADVRAEGLAGEIPANRWWVHLDSNQGSLPCIREALVAVEPSFRGREMPTTLVVARDLPLPHRAPHPSRLPRPVLDPVARLTRPAAHHQPVPTRH